MIKERLELYNQLTGPHGERLATLYRFQNKPNSDYPQIYLPHDSLLNHKSRLVRNSHILLRHILSPEQLEELQLILVSHDVPELIEGDVSRLAKTTKKSSAATAEKTLEELLLPEDIVRYRDFEKAQQFLERGAEDMPQNPLSFIARIIDTCDGNYFAYALLTHYATKVGGEVTDAHLQTMLDKSYAYVNKTRARYRQRVSLLQEQYGINVSHLLEHILENELQKLNAFSEIIGAQGYHVSRVE